MVRDFRILQLVLVIILDMFLGKLPRYSQTELCYEFSSWTIAVNIIVWSSMFVIEPVLSLMLQIADVRILLWRVIAMSFEDAKNLPLSMKKSIIIPDHFKKQSLYISQVDYLFVITSTRLWTHVCMISKSYAVDWKYYHSAPRFYGHTWQTNINPVDSI